MITNVLMQTKSTSRYAYVLKNCSRNINVKIQYSVL